MTAQDDLARTWQAVTLIKSEMVASNVKSLTFKVPNWIRHQAGQHYDIRLTAENGYQAERSYSAASAPEQEGEVEFGIQLLDNGEVSPYLYQLQPGDQIEIRGPIGGHFIWDVSMTDSLNLIGGGSGMVPLMSMLRHHFNHTDSRLIKFLVSAQDLDRVLYKAELAEDQAKDANFKMITTLTNNAPDNWTGYTRRVDEQMLTEVFGDVKNGRFYICGQTPFVEAVANGLVGLGIPSEKIKTERFGGA